MIDLLVRKKVIKKNKEDDYSLVVKGDVSKVSCKNLPDKYRGLSIKQALELFFGDCDIPHFAIMHKADGTKGRYNLRVHSKKSEQIFKQILANESIDFSILVARTRSWYTNRENARSKTSTYFETGIWKNIYENYEDKSSENNKYWQ